MKFLNRNKKAAAVIIFVITAMTVLIVFQNETLYHVQQIIIEKKEYVYRHEKRTALQDKKPLEDQPGAWYTKYHFIAHAGGGIDGRTYTNARQAWDESYRQGNRVFDADIAYTSDGVLVLRHSWGDNLEVCQGVLPKDSIHWTDRNGMYRISSSEQPVLDYETFINSKIYFKYDAMSCTDMLRYMDEHPDLYIACDMKDDMVESYRDLVRLARESGTEDVLGRIIVNLYDYDIYDQIMEIYDFKNFTMRQHYVSPNNYYEILEFCLSHDVHVVNVSGCYMEDEGISLLKSYGIKIITAITDDVNELYSYYKLGADGAVTNWLYEPDWNYIEQKIQEEQVNGS